MASSWLAVEVINVLLGAQANEEKDRLESKQRKDRLQAEMAGQPWKARWFELIMDKDYKGDSYLRWVYKVIISASVSSRESSLRLFACNTSLACR